MPPYKAFSRCDDRTTPRHVAVGAPTEEAVTLRAEVVAVADGTTIEVLVAGGERPGPRVAVLGGVHGDEPEGTLAVRQLAERLDGEQIAGKVVLVPVASPQAGAAGTRTSPVDGGNLARSFPGSPDGTATEQIAFAIDQRVIAGSDLLIDLHAAGRDYRMPLFAGAVDDGSSPSAASVRAAEQFGAPILWLHNTMNPGRSISAAWERKIPAIYVESGGGGSVSEDDLAAFVTGVGAVLAALGMTAGPRPGVVPRGRVIRGGDGDVDAGLVAPEDGFLLGAVAPGSSVAAGEALASIVPLAGGERSFIVAERDAVVMMIRHRSPIRRGELVAMLAPPFAGLDAERAPGSSS